MIPIITDEQYVLEINMAKLTLSMDPQTVKQAKKLAQDNHISLSSMIARFIQSLAARKNKTAPIGPLTKKATGVISLKGADYKDVLADELTKKHGRRA
jgi:hypothetical protein